MSKADDAFYRQFGLILGLLAIFFFAMLFLARSIGADAFERSNNSAKAVSMRLAPAGRVRVGDPTQTTAAAASAPAGTMVAAAPPATAPAAAPAGGDMGGEKAYQTACMACHMTGAAGAPKVGDKAAWEARAAQGLEAMITSALKGKGVMPAKGGNPSLSDADVTDAVKFMLEQTGITPG